MPDIRFVPERDQVPVFLAGPQIGQGETSGGIHAEREKSVFQTAFCRSFQRHAMERTDRIDPVSHRRKFFRGEADPVFRTGVFTRQVDRRMLATGAIDAERYEEYERRRAERD